MRRKTTSITDQHQDWLGQVDSDGPFLALPVLKDIWPQGVERLGDADDRMITFKQAYLQWQHAFDTYTEAIKTEETTEEYDAVDRAWIELVLDQLAGWQDLRVAADDPRLTELTVTSPGGEITVRASGALEGKDDGLGALLLVSAPTTDLRATGLDGWAATEVDRMAMLLRKARVEVGIITDGQWWAIVWAKEGKPTGSGMVNALTWAEEPLLRDAFLTLIDQRRFRAKDTEQRLPRLFERSELEAEEITEELGRQVRKSVELLVQAFSESRLAAAERGEPDPLTDKPDEIYQAAVTIMMRVVFLLFAEERDMLPTEQLYWDSYAIRDLLDDLLQRAADGEEHLDETYDAWHRLLAVSEALYGGVNYDEMRMPAYGGSLLDPARFPWLHATGSHGLRLKVSDRVMLHVFDSVQTVVIRNERRRISFRDIDVEQIGYIYEGLLGYTCQTVEGHDVVLGLVGKDGAEPEITLDRLQQMYDSATSTKTFATALVAWVKENQPAATTKTSNAIAKLVDKDLTKDEEAELTRLLTPVAGHDPDLLSQLVSWGNLIRRDLRDIPHVVPAGGLVVSETPSRKNAGAHYTPRSLAEEVVKYALEPLVYEPGPLQTNDENAWTLKSSTAILDLKIADIAAGSGAFLVAGARFLADRVTEAWTEEGMLSHAEEDNPNLADNRAIREVIARCLYGADINPMAIEMCKLSLWLVSMDKSKPFSFVDDKIICGNSLLGLTSLEQLKAIHLYPDPRVATDFLHESVNVENKFAEAIRLRKELAVPIEEPNPMRSTRGKKALLSQFENVMADLHVVADGIIATGLPLGGKPGSKLDDAYRVLRWELAQAFSHDDSLGDRTNIETRIESGLVPTVRTDQARWRPLHWLLEAPEVMVDRGGFDAIVGNPPFLADKRMKAVFGDCYREYLSRQIASNIRGGADLAAYFLLRAGALGASSSTLGLIATNTVAQGDSREVGLEQLAESSHRIYRAKSSHKWPSHGAQLEIVSIWLSREKAETGAAAWLDELPVRSISPLLEPELRSKGRPRKLSSNARVAFVGALLQGEGFIISDDERDEILAASPIDSEVILPYLNGAELNSDPHHGGSRWAINFGGRDESESRRYSAAFNRVERLVKPERAKVNRRANRERWWQYAEHRPGLYAAIRGQEAVLAISRVTAHPVFVRIPSPQVFSDRLVLITDASVDRLAVLSSRPHTVWIEKWGATLETRTMYPASDVFETFPFPDFTSRLENAGALLDTERREIMVRRQMGLTNLYNLISDSAIHGDEDVNRMRDLHVEIDVATMAAYGWQDIALDHGFHTYRQMERWTVSPTARVEILDRLLELNHHRAREEGQDVPDQEGLL